jgi:predicted permease
VNWWQRLRRRDDLEWQLDRELRDHLERQVASYVAAGVPPEQARRRARLEFGGLEQIKETCRDARGLRALDETIADVRYALRSFRAEPGLLAVAVATLALGIGANTAIFSLVNALMLEAPAVHDPSTLVYVSNCTGSEPAIAELARRGDVFTAVAGSMPTQFSLEAGGEPSWVDGLWITSAYFETLGVSLASGRLPLDAGNGHAEAIVSHSMWTRRFGSAPGAIGRRIEINNVPFTIVGIAPEGFTGLEVGRTFDIIVPYGMYERITGRAAEGCGPLTVVARLAPGRSAEGAESALSSAHADIRERLMPPALAADARGRFLSRPFAVTSATDVSSELRARYERLLAAMLAVAALVLLMACATIANLLLARASVRRHEASVRLALGASTGRLVRQRLIESTVIAALGAAGGVAVAWWASRAIVSALASESVLAVGRAVFGSAQLYLDVSPDWRVLGFAAAVACGAALLIGLATAVNALRVHAVQTLAPRVRPHGEGRAKTADGLVVAQVALSLVLLVAAGLFARSQASLRSIPLGFEPDRMLVVDIATPPSGAHGPRLPLYERTRRAVSRIAGVDDATLSISAPMTGWDLLVEVTLGVERSGAGADSLANIVTPGWFRTLGTRLVSGRDFEERDGAGAEPVVIVNQAFARQFLRGGAAVGRTIAISGMGEDSVPRRVVGVAADALWSLRDPVPPTLYIPLAQADAPSLELRLEEEGLTLGVRAARASPRQLIPEIAGVIAAQDSTLLATFRAPSEHLDASVTQERLLARISTFFGTLALALAAAGLYGVTSCAIGRRRAEMALRLALGSTPRRVLRAAVGHLAALVAAGVLLGAALSALLAPLASALLYGIGPRDRLAMTGAVLLLAGAIAAAVWTAARRALRLDLTAVLRSG